MAWRLFGRSITKEIAVSTLICGEGSIGVRKYYDSYFLGIRTGSGYYDDCIEGVAPPNSGGGKGKYIGFTPPYKSDWKRVEGKTEDTTGLSIFIDYTEGGFSKIPFIVPQLRGDVDIWAMQLSISNISNTSAIIYLRSTVKGYTPSVEEAIQKNWHIVYSAEENEWWKKYDYKPVLIPDGLNPCDNA